jgi:hypothetical protein
MRELETVTGDLVTIPDPAKLIHLQFRRFAGCPVCNLHLRSIVDRHDEIVRAGIREVVVFHSPAAELREHTEGLPFDVIADPDKHLYREYGVEASPRSLLNPRAWGAIVRGVLHDLGPALRGKGPAMKPTGGRFGLPGDFLIDPTGEVLASKRGEHAYDQWSVDELLALVRVR